MTTTILLKDEDDHKPALAAATGIYPHLTDMIARVNKLMGFIIAVEMKLNISSLSGSSVVRTESLHYGE